VNLKNSTAVLFVKDINLSKDFYVNVLQIPIELDFGKNIIFKNGFAIWEINPSHIITENLGFDKITNTYVNRFELYFETEKLDEIFEKLKSNIVYFLHEIHEESWGQRTIRFFDPDNHLIEIGETMEQFITRFYNQGMTIEQISEKTYVPKEDVIKFIK